MTIQYKSKANSLEIWTHKNKVEIAAHKNSIEIELIQLITPYSFVSPFQPSIIKVG